jgi:hypothetical protein
LSHLLCVGGIICLPWFSKELKNDLSKNNWLHGIILILLIRESIFVGWGFSFPIVLVPRYKLSLYHIPIKPDLLGFSNCMGCLTAWSRGSHHIIIKIKLPPRPWHSVTALLIKGSNSIKISQKNPQDSHLIQTTQQINLQNIRIPTHPNTTT